MENQHVQFFSLIYSASWNNVSHVLLIIRFHATKFPKIPEHEANVSIITSYQLTFMAKGFVVVFHVAMLPLIF